MKICRNCGWPNGDKEATCAKCGGRLPDVPDAEEHESAHTNVPPCAQCGYPVSSLLQHCPVCHTRLNNTIH